MKKSELYRKFLKNYNYWNERKKRTSNFESKSQCNNRAITWDTAAALLANAYIEDDMITPCGEVIPGWPKEDDEGMMDFDGSSST